MKLPGGEKSMARQDRSTEDALTAGSMAEDLVERVLEMVKTLVAEIPNSDEVADAHAEERARELTRAASWRAATISGTLALPPGSLGIMTILPDLLGIWRLQAKLVADIAALYGEKARLTQETLLYCLFRHAVAQVIRDLVVRVGERIVVQRASWTLSRKLLHRIGIEIIQRVTGRSVARLLPLIGAMGVAGYAFYDTAKVGQTAIEFFSGKMEVEEVEEGN
jgi:hypothetical protein